MMADTATATVTYQGGGGIQQQQQQQPAAVVIATDTIIVPPPSDKNPLPSVAIALRIDNYEQVIQLLSSSSSTIESSSSTTTATATATKTRYKNQFLMFGTESLRTLILRQVLNDPNNKVSSSSTGSSSSTNATNAQQQQQQQRYDTPITSFPNIPRHLNIIGTSILYDPKSNTTTPMTSTTTSTSTTTTSTSTSTTSTTVPTQQQQQPPYNNTEMITYFVHATDLIQTQLLCDYIVQYQQNYNRYHQQKNRSSTNANRNTNPASSSTPYIHHRIVYIPQIPLMVHKLLSNAGLVGTGNSSTSSTMNSTSNTPPIITTLHSLSLDLIPIESDVYSMELPSTIRELHVDGTPSMMITYIARSLLKLQDIVGTIPRIQSYGVASEQVVKKMLDLSVEEYYALQNNHTDPTDESVVSNNNNNNDEYSHRFSDIVSAMILYDRKIDMITPLVTPLTYEGLLDDVVGIDNGYISIDVNIINPPDDTNDNDVKDALGLDQGKIGKKDKTKTDISSQQQQLVSLAMNESDTMFGEIRDQHVEQFGTYLQQQAKSMQAKQNDFKATGKQKELSELHQFVKQLPHMKQKFQYLSTHIHLAELIKYTSEQAIFRERWQMERTILEGDTCYDELDDLVAMSYPLYRFVRLLCLQSICKNGINSSRYDILRKDFIQTYGYEFVTLLVNLEKVGLLRRKEAFLGIDKASAYTKVKDLLVLINAEVDTIEPDDISYVSSGYAPLTVRLLQSAVTGWKNGRDDILREIPGRFIDIVQLLPPEDLVTTMQRPINTGGATYGSLAPTNTNTTTTSRGGTSKSILIVVYLGGVTYMELSAIRFLSKRPNFPYHIICCTTSILNGNTFLQSLA